MKRELKHFLKTADSPHPHGPVAVRVTWPPHILALARQEVQGPFLAFVQEERPLAHSGLSLWNQGVASGSDAQEMHTRGAGGRAKGGGQTL